MGDDRQVRLKLYQSEAGVCSLCRELGVLYTDAVKGSARPILQRNPTGALAILIVGEAPNLPDTFDPDKGYLTYTHDTDPSGRFMRELLMKEVGLRAEEIDDVLFTNAVLCLPARRDDRYPVSSKQLDTCRVWLARLIEEAQPRVVVTMGASALGALKHIEPHGLTLQTGVGRMHSWFGRLLLPLYHPSFLGRVNRSEAEQRADIRPLAVFLGRRSPDL